MTAHEPRLYALDLPSRGGRSRLTDLVYDALSDAIAGAALLPGARLREVELAKHFGVSPTPVREALRRLERDGLVTVHPHRGATVATLSPRELSHLYEIHEVLECRAVRHAAEAAHPEHAFRRLEDVLTEATAVLDDLDQIAFNRIDLAFHRTLNQLGGNPPLAELTEQIHRRIQAVRIHCAVYLPDRPAQSHAQHQEILVAVRAHDAARAEELARAHIHSVRDAVVRVVTAGNHEGAALGAFVAPVAPPLPVDQIG